MSKLVNKKQLAEIVGKTERTLSAWQKQGLPISKEAKGRGAAHEYDTKEVIDWMINQEIDKRVKKHGSINELYDYEIERARLTHHQANKAALEEKVLHGELIPTDEVIRVQGNMVSAFRARSLSIPTKAAHSLLGVTDLNEGKAILKQFVYEALDELADFDATQYDIPKTQTDNSTG